MRSQWNYLRSREALWVNIIVNLKVQTRPYKYIHTTFLNPNLQHCTRHKHRGNSQSKSLNLPALPNPPRTSQPPKFPRNPMGLLSNKSPATNWHVSKYPPRHAHTHKDLPPLHFLTPMCISKDHAWKILKKKHQKKRNICVHEWMRTNRGQFSQQWSPTRKFPPISEPTTTRAAI